MKTTQTYNTRVTYKSDGSILIRLPQIFKNKRVSVVDSSEGFFIMEDSEGIKVSTHRSYSYITLRNKHFKSKPLKRKKYYVHNFEAEFDKGILSIKDFDLFAGLDKKQPTKTKKSNSDLDYDNSVYNLKKAKNFINKHVSLDNSYKLEIVEGSLVIKQIIEREI